MGLFFLVFNSNIGILDLLNFVRDILVPFYWPSVIFFIIILFKKELPLAIENFLKDRNLTAKTLMGDIYISKSQETEAKKSIKDRSVPDALINLEEEKNRFLVHYHFEKTYRLIFGSQLNILSNLELNPYFSREEIIKIYNASPISKSYPFINYMGFLVNMRFLDEIQSTSEYKLTDLGKLFLQYLRTENVLMIKPG